MESSMLKMLKTQNPDKAYPSNLGQKWTFEEEELLLEELSKDIDIKTIAINHNRTEGAIYARQKQMSYEMYLSNISYDEISQKIKLSISDIEETINKKKEFNKKKK
jgi:hypothetical protein